jgi:hypothetical protein
MATSPQQSAQPHTKFDIYVAANEGKITPGNPYRVDFRAVDASCVIYFGNADVFDCSSLELNKGQTKTRVRVHLDIQTDWSIVTTAKFTEVMMSMRSNPTPPVIP